MRHLIFSKQFIVSQSLLVLEIQVMNKSSSSTLSSDVIEQQFLVIIVFFYHQFYHLLSNKTRRNSTDRCQSQSRIWMKRTAGMLVLLQCTREFFFPHPTRSLPATLRTSKLSHVWRPSIERSWFRDNVKICTCINVPNPRTLFNWLSLRLRMIKFRQILKLFASMRSRKDVD